MRPRGGVPHCDGRRGETRVSEIANGDGHVPGETFVLPEDGRAARRAEMIGHRVAALGCPLPLRRFTGEGDLLAAEARLVAAHRPSTALALQAVAHSDARWFALNREVKLPAAAGGASGHWVGLHGHRRGRSVGWSSKRCTSDFPT